MRLWRRIARQRWAKAAVGVTAAEYLRFVGTTTRFTLEPHDIYARGEADTEALRKAVVYYRALFTDLLEVRGSAPASTQPERAKVKS